MDGRRLARFGDEKANRGQTEYIYVHEMDSRIVVGTRGE